MSFEFLSFSEPYAYLKMQLFTVNNKSVAGCCSAADWQGPLQNQRVQGVPRLSPLTAGDKHQHAL